jgi:hypothetical protein
MLVAVNVRNPRARRDNLLNLRPAFPFDVDRAQLAAK